MSHEFFRARRALLAAAFLAVLGMVWTAGAVHAAPGPVESIAMLQKGVDTRDLALVEKYLDSDGTVVKAVDVIVTDKDILRQAGQASFAIAAILAMGSDEKMVPVLRDLMKSEAREYIRHGVVSGAFAGAPQEGVSTYGGIFGKVFRGGNKDRKKFGPATLKTSGKETAVVATTLADGAKGRTYPLELRLERQQGIWRVVEIVNVSQLVLKAKEKETQ